MKMKKEMAVIILAAGKSTRMKSEVPKVLHKLCGRSMLGYVLDLADDYGSHCDNGSVKISNMNNEYLNFEIQAKEYHCLMEKEEYRCLMRILIISSI